MNLIHILGSSMSAASDDDRDCNSSNVDSESMTLDSGSSTPVPIRMTLKRPSDMVPLFTQMRKLVFFLPHPDKT